MNMIICELCGGNDFLKDEGVFVCQGCGCKYSLDEVKKMMQTPATVINATQNDSSEEDKVDTLLKLASNIIIEYIDLTDGSKEISESEYLEAKKYLERAEEKSPEKWEIWFYKGMLAQIQSYDKKAPSSFQEFERAMRLADEDAITKRILPHIRNYEGLITEAIDTILTRGEEVSLGYLEDFLDFYTKFSYTSDYAKSCSEAIERFQVIKHEIEEKKRVADDAKRQEFSEVIKKLNQCKEAMIALRKEESQIQPSITEVITQISSCGLLDGKRKRELLDLKQKILDRDIQIQKEIKANCNEAYEIMAAGFACPPDKTWWINEYEKRTARCVRTIVNNYPHEGTDEEYIYENLKDLGFAIDDYMRQYERDQILKRM